MYVLVAALSQGAKNLEYLSVQLHTAGVNCGQFLAPLKVNGHVLATEAFLGIQRLHVRLHHTDWIHEISGTAIKELSIKTMLRVSTVLESLTIKLDQPTVYKDQHTVDKSAERNHLHWRDFVPHRFGRLRDLTIDGVDLHTSDFTRFLRQSCQDLKSFNIGSATVVQGSWNGILESIRKLSNLEDIMILDLWEDAHNWVKGNLVFDSEAPFDPKPLYNFLLGRSDNNPWKTMCEATAAHWAKIQAADAQSET